MDTENDPNREFASVETTAVWFFVFLPVFIVLFVVYLKLGVG
ncbi:hypothetical protein ACVIN2_002398 [Bradyrhizobium sp. USDA 3650]